MQPGKARPKLELAVSFARRRLRLGVAHHGAPSAWIPPAKDVTTKIKKR